MIGCPTFLFCRRRSELASVLRIQMLLDDHMKCFLWADTNFHNPADNLHRFKQSIHGADDHEIERALIVHPEWVNTQR